MGYTHYWYRQPEREHPEMFGRLCTDAVRIIDTAHADGIELKADFTEGWLSVNGFGDEACEDFYWLADPRSLPVEYDFLFDDGEFFSCCKTRGRAYDPVVVALLLRAHDIYAPSGMSYSSDGTFTREWLPGRDLYARAFAEEIAMAVTTGWT